MRNLRAQLTYDGSRFHGWQRQDGFASVQQAVEEALAELLGSPVVVRGAGRTDTGVHALRQVASFHADTRLDDERLLHALNAHLPEGVACRDIETCRDDFHAQKDARGKRYGYLIRTTAFRSPLGRPYAHWVREPLDLAAMRAGAAHLVGEHDFRAFASSGSPRRTSVRTLHAVHLVARRDSLWIVLQGSGFLYNMARAIVGTLLDVGRGRRPADDVAAILASRSRASAGATAPACGLYLVRVLYREPCFAAGRARRS